MQTFYIVMFKYHIHTPQEMVTKYSYQIADLTSKKEKSYSLYENFTFLSNNYGNIRDSLKD